jgi:hypothetical protein
VAPALAAPHCPNLVILLDQSASMAQTPAGKPPAAGEKSKWDIATAVLTNLNNKYTGLLPIGYTNFPSRNLPGCDTQAFNVPVAYGNATQVAINNAMIAFPFPGGSTPTCTAVSKLAAQSQLQDQSRGQYILLVTDGSPDAACCPPDPVAATVSAISAAAAQSPPIYTIVVGFGVLPSEQATLNKLALAGGKASADPVNKFYSASDQASLDLALSGILNQLVGGDAGSPVTCEDGCYGTACPSGQVCIQDQCKPNPCQSQVCPPSQYCLFDGSKATCTNSCSQSCPLGSRCANGSCILDDCGGPCLPGQMCSGGQCVADPKCQNVVCHVTQGCVKGACVDNPCVYTTCPGGTECIDFSGACMPPRPASGGSGSGCSCDFSRGSRAASFSPLAALLVLALALLIRGRRAPSGEK